MAENRVAFEAAAARLETAVAFMLQAADTAAGENVTSDDRRRARRDLLNHAREYGAALRAIARSGRN